MTTARPDTACCCGSGGGSGDRVCCGESDGCSSPPSDKYHRISIAISFTNYYNYRFSWTEPVPAGYICEPGGGAYGASTTVSTITDSLGRYGGILTASKHKCGASGCQNGNTIPGTNPPETVPGVCAASNNFCDQVCLPYDWESCCKDPVSNPQPNCGDLSIAVVNKIRDARTIGHLNFTVKASSQSTGMTNPPQPGECSTCGGCVGFKRDFAPSNIVSGSWYVTNTNYQEVKWGVADSSSDCPTGYKCHKQDINFWCTDSILDYWEDTNTPFKYFSAKGQFLVSPPSSSLIPYIDLRDYPGSIVACLYVKTHLPVIDELLIDAGWGACGYQDSESEINYDAGTVAFVAPCGTTAANFYPFGSVGIETTSRVSRIAAGSFSVPHDLDDWSD